MKKTYLLLVFLFITFSITSKDPTPTIYVYNGSGTSASSLIQTLHALKHYATPYQKVKTINHVQIAKGIWKNDAILFVMPGGADIPYCKYLKGSANQEIKSFVEEGGTYLGICAGAYYGCKKIKFAENTPLEVIGNRELAFFPGLSVGPYLAPYDYKSKIGARAAHLKQEGLPNAIVYYNGGGYFVNPEKYKNVKVLSRYFFLDRPDSEAAIIEINVGRGKVILSGPHFEFNPTYMDNTNRYLVPIIAEMSKTKKQREILIKYILRRLGVQLSKKEIKNTFFSKSWLSARSYKNFRYKHNIKFFHGQ